MKFRKASVEFLKMKFGKVKYIGLKFYLFAILFAQSSIGLILSPVLI